LGQVKGFLGKNESTIFCINGCLSGRSINTFSGHPNEQEVIIPPGSMFQIVGILEGEVWTLIQVKQLASLEVHLKLE